MWVMHARRRKKPDLYFITGGNLYGSCNCKSRLLLRTNMILGCAITESTGIYSLVISLLLLFVF